MPKIVGLIPFIAVSFLNAFVDLGHKITIQNTIYKVYDGAYLTYLSTIINALILLPFILFFTPSGFLSDKYPKNKVMCVSALVSVFLCICLTIFYYNGLFYLAFAATFLMAVQSAILSPAKYGYIKDLVKKDLLTWGNGIMQATAIVAILSGIVCFSLLFEALLSNIDITNYQKSDILKAIAPLGFLLIISALIELYLTTKLKSFTKTNYQEKFDFKAYFKGHLLVSNLKLLKAHKNISLSVVGIAMFFAVSQLLLASFPTYVKEQFNELNTFKVQAIIAFSGLGIMAGSIITGRFSKNYIETGLIPLGAIILSVTTLCILSLHSTFAYSILFFILGMGGAFFIIPLHALIQFHAPDKTLGRILAGNNFIQNITMLLFLIIGAIASIFDINVRYLFYFCMIVVVSCSIYVIKKIPFALARLFVTLVFRQRYRLIVRGFDKVPECGGVLLLGNHISFIDWALIQLALPRKVYFVIDREYYDKWYLHFILKIFGVIPVSAKGSKGAIEEISNKLKSGNMVCLFPEGCLSRHGGLNTFKHGFELACKNLDKKDALILPFYLRGLWGSAFSRSHLNFKQRRKSLKKRKVTIAFGDALDIHTNAVHVKTKVFELSLTAFKDQCYTLPTIGSAFLSCAKKYKSKTAIIDSTTGKISYIKMLAICMTLCRSIKREIKDQKSIGIMLPASMGGSILNIAALFASLKLVNLNFTQETKVLERCIEKAGIKTLYTSRKFIQKLSKKGINFNFDNINIIYLEDLFVTLKAHKGVFIKNLLKAYFVPTFILKYMYFKNIKNTDVAAILFSSGSEGEPKGVMLSHLNIMSNIAQISDVIQARENESILSSLPPFHAFGMTVTMFLPLVEGILSVTHADPTDALGVAKAIARNKVSILCGTSTFLGIYARSKKVDPIMFESIRVVVAGAEKLKDDVKNSFALKFKKDILEGYGATETTPVASVNLPNELDTEDFSIHRATKDGSVGMPLPGSAVRIVDPDTLKELPIGEDGLILIGGHQVMVGYLNDQKRTDDVIVNIDGVRWYKSGDKGHIDTDGFLYIVDRYSRFAKIGGEMISLSFIEDEIDKVIDKDVVGPYIRFIAVNVDDKKKGEKIVLLVSHCTSISALQESIKRSNIKPLAMPSDIIELDEIPLLGSGKVDFKMAKTIALKSMQL